LIGLIVYKSSTRGIMGYAAGMARLCYCAAHTLDLVPNRGEIRGAHLDDPAACPA
jgi:hypothetical protein